MTIGKLVTKNNFFILFILSMMLLVGLVGVVFYHFSSIADFESRLAEKDQTSANLNSTINNLSVQIIDLENQLEQANNAMASLQGNYDDTIQSYIRIITLQASGLLINGAGFSQNANESTQMFFSPLEYAGYIAVNVVSNSSTTYIQVIYDSFGVNFNQQISVGESGVASFPILPGIVEILVGNEEIASSVAGTVTINYVY